MRHYLSIPHPRASTSATVGLAIGLAVALLGYGSLTAGAGRSAAPRQDPTPTSTPEPCTLVADKQALPSQVRLGSSVQISLSLQVTCTYEPDPLHVVFVMDATQSVLQGPEGQRQADTVRSLLEAFDLENQPNRRAAVVAYHSTAQVLCSMTRDVARLRTCINNPRPGVGRSIAAGIDEGVRELRQSRTLAADSAKLKEILIVLAASGSDAGCPPDIQAVGSAKSQSILVISICIALECDASSACLRQMATSPRYYFDNPASAAIEEFFQRLNDTGPRPGSLVMTDTLPANMSYVAGSAVPVAAESAGQLVWTFPMSTTTVFTATFRIVPSESGVHPTNAGAQARYVIAGVAYHQTFPVPMVDVIGPPTDTPTATAVDTPSPTPTRPPPQRYWVALPVALDGATLR